MYFGVDGGSIARWPFCVSGVIRFSSSGVINCIGGLVCVTFYLLRDIAFVSEQLWSLIQNYGNSSMLLFLLDAGSENPDAVSNFGKSQGAAISYMESFMLPLAGATMMFYEPFNHNLEMRKLILGWATSRAQQPQTSSDCGL